MRFIQICSSLAALAGAVMFYQSSLLTTHNKTLQEAKGLTLVISEQKVGGAPEEHKVTLGKKGEFRWENSKRLIMSDGKTVWTLDKAKNSYTETAFGPDTLKRTLSGPVLVAWIAFLDGEWEKGFAGAKAGRDRNMRGTAVSEVLLTVPGSTKPMILLLDSKTKVAKGAIVSSGDAETIIFATKFELAAEAPAAELFAFAAPEGAAKVEATAASMVYADVQPIFHRNCTGCHGAGLARANLNMASYGGIQKGGKSGPGFLAGDPDNSLILQHMRGQKRQMPPSGKLPDSDLEKVAAWIAAGAIYE